MRSVCSRGDCDRQVQARGLCSAHYQRLRRGTDLDSPLRQRDGQPWISSTGYYATYVDGRMDYVHRLVMEEALGRKLRPGETVHHINGCKTDNRPENLELWASTQPAGQRVEQLIEWARDIIRVYGSYFPEEESDGIPQGDS